jgi:hypothetical protein
MTLIMLLPVAISLRTLEFKADEAILCRFSQKFITGHYFSAVSWWKNFPTLF